MDITFHCSPGRGGVAHPPFFESPPEVPSMGGDSAELGPWHALEAERLERKQD